jgi:hypothetical protein
MRRKRCRIGIEGLEERFALSAFGQLVSDQAQNPALVDPDATTFGEHQSDVAKAAGGLGQFNRNDGPFDALKHS